MNIFIKLSLAFIILVAESCESTKSTVSEETNKEVSSNTEEMKASLMQEGYAMGTVKYLSNSKCSYIIVDEKTGAQFDPINMQEERFTAYKNNDVKIYYKYRPLRMMNRCNEAQPIELEDIKKRED